MLKKKLSGILLVVFVLWLIVTSYFYSQHQRNVWAVEVPGWEYLDRQGMQVKKVILYDWDKKKAPLNFRKEIFTFIAKLTKNLPREWKQKVYLTAGTLIYFYSDPYASWEGYRIELRGYALKDRFEGAMEKGDFNVFINGRSIGGWGRSWRITDCTNLIEFEVRSTYYSNISDINLIQLRWKMDDGTYLVQFIPVKELDIRKNLLGFFDSQYPAKQEAEKIAADFVLGIASGKENVEDLISRNLSQFPWKRVMGNKITPEQRISWTQLSYVGDYKGFEHVFSITLEYFDIKQNNVDAYQTFYFIEEDNQWRIIDIGELKQGSTPL